MTLTPTKPIKLSASLNQPWPKGVKASHIARPQPAAVRLRHELWQQRSAAAKGVVPISKTTKGSATNHKTAKFPQGPTALSTRNRRARVLSNAAGFVSGVVGADLAWRPLLAPKGINSGVATAPLSTAAAAATWVRAALLARGSLFGLVAGVDDLVLVDAKVITPPALHVAKHIAKVTPPSTTPQPSAKIGNNRSALVRFRRTHGGLPVLGDGVVVLVSAKREVQHLMARISPGVSTLAGSSALTVAKLAGSSGGLLPRHGKLVSPKAWLEPVTIQPQGAQLLVRRAADGKVLRKHDAMAHAPYESVVTRRGPDGGDISSAANQCVASFNGQAMQCADTGVPSWRFGGATTTLCCPACVAGGCDPSCVTNCNTTPPSLYAGGWSTTVTNAATMRDELALIGVTTLSAGAGDAVVISGQVADPNDPPDPANPQNQSWLPCDATNPVQNQKPPAKKACNGFGAPSCFGNVKPLACGEAFYPTLGFSHSCASGIGPAAGTILLSDQANSALDVMAHEFGHIWLNTQGFPYHPDDSVGVQPRAIHESLSDQLAVVVDSDNWLVGDRTDCATYRSLCDGTCSGSISFSDVGCLSTAQVVGQASCQAHPIHFSNYTLFPNADLSQSSHINAGIPSFAGFLFGADLTHQIGNQTIQGQSRASLGALLGQQAVPQLLALNPQPGAESMITLQGYREAMIRGALMLNPSAGISMEAAQDAIGIWRDDGLSTLLGVGRVGGFGWHDAGTDERWLFVVNWDGERQNWIARCLVVDGTCAFVNDMQPLSDFLYIQDNGPAAPLATVSVDEQHASIYYPTVQGKIAVIDFVDGSFTMAPTIQNIPMGTLGPNIGVGAAWDPQWPGIPEDDTLIAYHCRQSSCTCNGIQPGQGGSICVTNRAGTWQAEVTHDVGTTGPAITPNLVSVNGVAMVAWVQNVEIAGLPTPIVVYSICPDINTPTVWANATQWTTAGQLTEEDLPAIPEGEIALGVLPGVEPGMEDRVYLQYGSRDPPLNSISWLDHLSVAIQGAEALGFASGTLDPHGTINGLQRRSMGVPQNGDAFSLYPAVFAGGRSSVGGFYRFAGRSWALTRRAIDGDLLGVGSMQPDGFWRVSVQSLGWR